MREKWAGIIHTVWLALHICDAVLTEKSWCLLQYCPSLYGFDDASRDIGRYTGTNQIQTSCMLMYDSTRLAQISLGNICGSTQLVLSDVSQITLAQIFGSGLTQICLAQIWIIIAELWWIAILQCILGTVTIQLGVTCHIQAWRWGGGDRYIATFLWGLRSYFNVLIVSVDIIDIDCLGMLLAKMT